MQDVKWKDLGRKDYREVWQQQQALQQEVKEQKLAGTGFPGYLLLVEHFPVYTLGKSGNEANLLVDAIQLRARQAEFIQVDRGGDITFHGLGQLVVYPVLDLECFHLGIKEYVHRLEEVVIRVLKEYGIEGERLEGATGVWLEAHTARARKICAIGVKCSRYVTMHGFALNINTDLTYFNAIHPCGFVDKGVTSLARELDREVPLEEVKKRVCHGFETLFDMRFIG